MTDSDLDAHARDLIETNRYLTLGTTGPDGAPWLTPVYFAPAGDREFVWVSALDAHHSRNLAERPRASAVVFDSTVQPYHGRAVYAAGEARELAGDDLERALAGYPRSDGAADMSLGDVTAPSAYRLYAFTASEMWVLCPREPGTPCQRHGRSDDHRVEL
ncbi:pyridoxamine 5'-phosphate oxidase family protein [Amycolatopsis sp. WQ 127309]|uniref:pyridoxamine 5'-phosphate oxidase family protein n=1 Tax=Amycolatopsis sp. WQ 127309 TaxID=2932773 RepID=UPI001FF6A2A8|nr:pyridoxamine 5'-phosphate oxidase family protein [Amycolatopsis sp. WQ 127309]UOZ02894.1 pyridoxamine 5'-phosphate oxidase family protein [Amycolatopsis sp. WQ 127309]